MKLFVTDCLIIVQRVKLRAKLLHEMQDGSMFDDYTSKLKDNCFSSAEEFFCAFEDALETMPMTLTYFKEHKRHHEQRNEIEQLEVPQHNQSDVFYDMFAKAAQKSSA